MKKVAYSEISNWGLPNAQHFNMRSARFMGADQGLKTFWCGLSEYEPGGGIEYSGEDSPNEKTYTVIEGELTLTDKDGNKFVLGPKDTIFIGPGEGRSVLNTGTTKATMMVVVNVIPS
jgi:mannose-6-phosphate isomerase-like protein (cupin superfamily)